MYPDIHLDGNFRHSPAAGPQDSTSVPITEPTTSSILRVVVGEQFRVAPPIPLPSGTVFRGPATESQAAMSTNVVDTEFEVSLINELKVPSKRGQLTREKASDRFHALVLQAMSAGHEKQEILLGIAAALAISGLRANLSEIIKQSTYVKELTSMGFTRKAAVGALITKMGDRDSALDML